LGEIEEELHEWWEKKRPEIESRLSDFKVVGQSGEKRIFEELCFCLLTPQSSALAADRAIRHLIHTKLLYDGTPQQITPIISGAGIRFGDNKGRYIVQAREKLMGEGAILSLPDLLVDDPKKARENVVENIKGLGYKESSHFLRNIGYEGLAILDRHILRTLCEACVIDCYPATISKKTYMELEEKLEEYARSLGIPLDALDMVMWSGKTGRVFK
jgi:N-glycosylase/DNA lyase